MNLDYLAQRVATVGLRKSQAIFMTDPEGTVAFHTGLPQVEWGRRMLVDYPPVRSAIMGVPGRERERGSPLHDVRIVATLRSARHGWVIGVSVPRDEVLQAVQADLVCRLLLFSGVLAFAGLVPDGYQPAP